MSLIKIRTEDYIKYIDANKIVSMYVDCDARRDILTIKAAIWNSPDTYGYELIDSFLLRNIVKEFATEVTDYHTIIKKTVHETIEKIAEEIANSTAIIDTTAIMIHIANGHILSLQKRKLVDSNDI